MTADRALRATLAGSDAGLGVGPAVVDPGGSAGRLEPRGEGRAILHADPAPPRRVILGAADTTASDGEREVVVDGWRFLVHVESEAHAALRDRARRGGGRAGAGGPTEVRAVIPGRVLSVAVAEGEDVEAGQPLLVVEAMKMQNELRAPRAGTVARVAAAAGRTVELGDVLVVLA